MTKSHSTKRTPRNTADKLSQLGKKSGVELTETQLDKAAGGLIGLLRSSDLKI